MNIGTSTKQNALEAFTNTATETAGAAFKSVVDDKGDEKNPAVISDAVNNAVRTSSQDCRGLEQATEICEFNGIVGGKEKRFSDFTEPAGAAFKSVVDDDRRLFTVRPEIYKMLLPHQIEGIQFMYKNVITGGGCVLAHAMGLGKTLQALVLCEILQKWKIICVMPAIMISSWENEIRRFNFEFDTFNLAKNSSVKIELIREWSKNGGVCLVGYEAFNQILKKKFQVWEPDQLIFDEGHRIKNLDSKMSTNLNSVNCKRRVILSGYALQNNLLEYYNMIEFIQPNYLGTVKEFKSLFSLKIEKCDFSCDEDVEIMKRRVYVLHNLLSKFVHRKSDKMLKDTLPDIHHFVILIKKSDYQKELLKKYSKLHGSVFSMFSITLKIGAHPDLGLDENLMLDTDEDETEDVLNAEVMLSSGHVEDELEIVNESIFNGYAQDVVENSNKMKLCLDILSECIKIGDKVIVFSQSLVALSKIERFLQLSTNTKWTKNWNYFRMDGTTPLKEREEMIVEFKDNPNVFVFLMSNKACAQGINLTSANRVILFDSSCFDMQAVSRCYRYGQKKTCYIYRLILNDCIEKDVYYKQIKKQGVFARVVDQCDIVLGKSTHGVDESHNYADSVIQGICENSKDLLWQLPFEHDMLLCDAELDLTDEIKHFAEREYAEEKMAMKVENAGDKTEPLSNTATRSKKNHLDRESSAKRKKDNIATNDTGAEDVQPSSTKTPCRWIPVDVWRKKGMHAECIIVSKDMTLQNNGNSVLLRKGENVMKITNGKGKSYIQTQSGKVIATSDNFMN